MSRLKLTCREATRLLLEQEGRALGPVERLGLRVHLGLCDACRHFRSQVGFMRGAMARWRSYRDEE